MTKEKKTPLDIPQTAEGGSKTQVEKNKEEVQVVENFGKFPDEKRVLNAEVSGEMKKSYLDYAMSVIVSRAIPSIEDGMKPVQRRILYSMQQMGLKPNTQTKKSARIVGDVIGKYHPHGDSAVYDAMVRMAQDFSLRYPLVFGQGNFGSIDGDPPAAYRYCVSGDSLILTDKGLIRIDELSHKENININVLSKDKKINKASKLFDSGIHDTLEITTDKGYSLTGSYNHPILTITSDEYGKPVFMWKTFNQIKEGDYAVLDRLEDDFWPEKEINLEQFKPIIKSKKTNVKILPDFLNKNLGFLLGSLVAEGFVGKNKIEFCNSDLNWINKFEKKWNGVFPDSKLHKFKRNSSSYGKKEYWRLECHSRYTLEFLRNIGLKNVLSKDKRIPEIIFRSSKETAREFIISYFEGDGNVSFSKKMMELRACSTSEKLIKDLQILMLRFGIDSFKRFDKHKNLFLLQIRGKKNFLRFYKELGFFSDRKKKALEMVLMSYKKDYSSKDFVPFISNFIRNLCSSEFIVKNNFDRYSNMEKNYGEVCQILDKKININFKSLFEYFLNYQYLFDKIVSIKSAGKQKVYSVKVESDCHSFISNGFINHNTEAKLQQLSSELLEDIDKETVEFAPNFDNSLKEPSLLPGKLPALLLNGATGIAVGMATNIPPHNLREVCDAINLCVDNPEASIDDIVQVITGPDFPTGGQVQGDMAELYKTGRGKLIMRGKISEEQLKNKEALIITEIPYMVNKSTLIEQIANLVRDKKIKDISDLRDESSKGKIRIVIELRKGVDASFVMNGLYKYTRLQDSFNVNFLALVGNQPRILSIKDALTEYINYRKIVITNRTNFELKKTKSRKEIVDGLLIALDNLDEVIKIIRKDKTPSETLRKKFKFTENQVKAILETKLRQLTALEHNKLKDELKELIKRIEKYEKILGNIKEILKIIKKEVSELKEKYGDARRTQVLKRGFGEISERDLVQEKEVVVSITDKGYVKRMDVQTYKEQKRGGKGVIGSGLATGDFTKQLLTCSTHDYLMFFTTRGRVLWLKTYDLPEAERYSKGKAIVNLLGLKDERVTNVLSIKNFEDFLVMGTKKGQVKRISLSHFSKPRSSGVKAINLPIDGSDELIGVEIIKEGQEVSMATRDGKAIRFNSKELRPMGRSSYGVTGIKMGAEDEVVSLEVLDTEAIFTITEKGYGKRTAVEDYRKTARAGKGVINLKVSDKTGKVVNAISVNEGDSIIITTGKGMVIRTSLNNIRVMGRAAQGVRVVKLQAGDKVTDVVKVVDSNGE